MKKIYKKPYVAIESFVSEEIMTGIEPNALSTVTVTDELGHEWNFISEDNVLNSINYSEFNN